MNPATEPGPSQYVFNAASNARPKPPRSPPPIRPTAPNQPKPTPKYIICPFGPPIQLRPDGRRKRFHAARDQLVMLEAIFQQNKKPNAKERVEICKRVNMNPRSLQIWFQNRRCAAFVSQFANHAWLIYPIFRAKDKKGIAVNIGGDSGDASEDRPNAGSSASSAPILRHAHHQLPITAISDMSVHSVPENASLSALVLQTNMAPSFFRQMQEGEVQSNLSSTPGFVACSDFTEHMQASTVLCHILEGSHKEMEKGFTILQNYFNDKFFAPSLPPSSNQVVYSDSNRLQPQDLSNSGVDLSIQPSPYYYPETQTQAFGNFLVGEGNPAASNNISWPP
ncbi:hypothetical protein BCR33DRAFT_717357 [Rhizoclosmatium globosum]|uniref:Homeobox domain-containing protein n=1 Tax=Rhizoclosmatium globosum TaxID=329046 RepID=A0A1Y2C9H8_9FUNG|nr:hypothetical protein BCR33DRAFT_717357 [Rhizoclosmatium globosum]|eukprot:ORY43690.1 hypothetical protein BCR33DRAFT_717357 [Rhizoclosmatium globosum]